MRFCGIHMSAISQCIMSLLKTMHFILLPHLTGTNELTHWGWDKMDAISPKTFSSAFYWMKMYELQLKIHWSLFLRVQLTIFQQIMVWHRPGHKPLSEPMLVSSPTHICVTRPQCVNATCTDKSRTWIRTSVYLLISKTSYNKIS